MRQLKERARREEVSVSSLLNQLLRLALSGTQPVRTKAYREKTYDMGQPLIDLTHTNAVIEELENQEFIRKMTLGK
jgi:hypothetical protein